MRNYITKLGLAVSAALIAGSTALAQDVVVSKLEKGKKPVRTVVDISTLREQKHQSQGKQAWDMSTPAQDRTAVKEHGPFLSPAYEGEEPEGFKVLFDVVDETPDFDGYYSPYKVYVCKGDGAYSHNYAYKPEGEEAEIYAWGCYVPEGEYTVILATDRYEKTDEPYVLEGVKLTPCYIVLEGVKIDGDKTITFRQSDAKNLITSKMLLPDGSEIPPSILYNLDENGESTCEMGFSRTMLNKADDCCLNMMNLGGSRDEIYVNDLSDEWVYALNFTYADATGAYQAAIVERGPFTSSVTLSNDPQDYTCTTVRFNDELPGIDTETKGFGIEAEGYWKGADWNMGANAYFQGYFNATDEIPVYLYRNRKADIDFMQFDFTAFVAVLYQQITYTEDSGDGEETYVENVMISGPRMYMDNEDYITCIPYEGYTDEKYPEETFYFPIISPFAYDKTADTEFFSFAPVMLTSTGSYIDNDPEYPYYLLAAVTELQYPQLMSGLLPVTTTATFNGKIIAENSPNFDLREWAWDNYREPGLVEVTTHAPYSTTEPELNFTEATVIFDTSKEDYFSPQVTLWQPRTAEGTVSDQLNAASKILFTTGDENPDDTDYTVKAFYRQSGTQEWLPLAYTGDTEGNVRTCEFSLADFDGAFGAWYDLRFESEDASDNRAIQTVGHAFRFHDVTGLNGIDADSTTVNPVYYDLTGRRVLNPDKGIYIRLAGNQATKLVK